MDGFVKVVHSDKLQMDCVLGICKAEFYLKNTVHENNFGVDYQIKSCKLLVPS